MQKEKTLKSSIVKRLNKFSKDKLQNVLKYLDKIEDSGNNREEILSYAGSWSLIEQNTFDDFTRHLLKRRKANKSRKAR
jgi:5-methylcytosine-specific restriction endonuclease McrBC regulatory subunit McrC